MAWLSIKYLVITPIAQVTTILDTAFVSTVAPKSELPAPPDPQREGMSHAAAHMMGEALQADADRGHVTHVESEPMGRVLARMDQVLPRAEQYDWLMEKKEELGGYRPIDYVDADDLEPVQQLLNDMPETDRTV